LVHACATDVGCRRIKNEDTVGFMATEARERTFVMIVADGVGGNVAGDVASRLAVQTVERETFRDGEPHRPAEAMRIALEEANAEILRHVAAHPDLAGMATTCTVALLRGAELNLAHIGDCRAYLANAKHLTQITNDHSLDAEYRRQGRELPEGGHNLANVLTRWLGAEEGIQVELHERVSMAVDDTLLLCSDGLNKVVDDAEIHRMITTRSPRAACGDLVRLVRERGAPDNVSLHVARLERIRKTPA
jgi:protein phosphatase